MAERKLYSKRVALIWMGLSLSAVSITAHAALTTVEQVPLATASSTAVKANVMFILDDSGSMDETDIPDFTSSSYVGWRNHLCNALYYDPNKTYKPAYKYDGTLYSNSYFQPVVVNGQTISNGAWIDGYTGGTQRNLNTSFGVTSKTANEGVRAYYYRWQGAGVPTMTDCKKSTSNPGANWVRVTLPVNAAQEQNFANWYSYHRTRMHAMKYATGKAFQQIDDSVRLGLITINPGSPVLASDYLKIDDFTTTSGGHKQAWFNKLYAITAGGTAGSNTPLHEALSRVGRHYANKTTGLNSGMSTDPVQYACQRNYAILTTDGFWNPSPGHYSQDLDGDTISDVDGTAAVARPMYDAASAPGTLADTAQYYYITDLRSNGSIGALGFDVGPNILKPAGSGAEDDTATHQHMTTFTFGLGVSGTLPFRRDYKTASTGTFADIRDGDLNWPVPTILDPTGVDDLWHAAVNGRGHYFSAQNPDDAANDLESAINATGEAFGVGGGAAASGLNVNNGDKLFIPSYVAGAWSGTIEAYNIDTSTALPLPGIVWDANLKLGAKVGTACDNRNIFLFDPSAANGLKPFTMGTYACDGLLNPTGTAQTALVSAAETAAFNQANAISQFSHYSLMTDGTSGTVNQRVNAAGAPLVNYLRGQSANHDFSPDSTKYFRKRTGILGDFGHAGPAHVGAPQFVYNSTDNPGYAAYKTAHGSRQKMLYAPANDGMVHAFDADTGEERYALIPSMVLSQLSQRASKGFAASHKFILDGTPVIADVYSSGAWSTILVAGVGRGGQGYYAMDVTNPANPQALWEFKQGACYSAGVQEYTDCNLGLAIGKPFVTKHPVTKKWVVLITSGVNNVNGHPGDGHGFLYVLEARTGKILHKLSTATGSAATPSGLTELAVYAKDLASDNVAERVYAGDMLGNVWRFDLAGTTGLGAVSLMATLKDPGGNPQPITAAPAVGTIGVPAKAFVAVQTGRYLGLNDLADTQTQSIYAFTDKLGSTINNPRSVLSSRLLQNATFLDRDVVCPLPAGCKVDPDGWYADFPDVGERGTVAPELYAGMLIFGSNVPNNQPCITGGHSYFHLVDYMTGAEIAGFKITDALIVSVSFVVLPNGDVKAIATLTDKTLDTDNTDEKISCAVGGNPCPVVSRDIPDKKLPFQAKSLSWRELIKN